uniref:hypothetical protein n=1 Tax=Rheinheimera sp. TaxID=1869214 RepID=UPI0040487713
QSLDQPRADSPAGLLQQASYLHVTHPGNIELFIDDVPTPIISPDAYVRDVEKQARARKMGAAIGAAFQQAGAAMKASAPTYSTTSGTANVYTPNYGSTNVNYRSTTTTYNPSANATGQAIESANINNQLNQNIQQIEAEKNENLETSSELLRRNSIAPNKSIYGVVILPAKKLKTGSRVDVKISVDDEIHVFNFRVDPSEEVD